MIKNLAHQYLETHETTLIGTFSYLHMVEPWFQALKRMKLPRKKIHLIIYNNSTSVALHSALLMQIMLIEHQYLSVKYHKSNRTGGKVIVGDNNDSFKDTKQKPIWAMWTDLNKMIETDVFFMIEDDTIVPPHAFTTLLNDLLTLDKAGFVIGIETGRTLFSWSKVRLGVHYLERKGNKLIKRISLHPDEKGIKEIDCSGVYCFVAYKKAWLSGFKGYDPTDMKIPFYAMDNVLTNNIKRKGWKIYADFNVWCDHLQLSAGELVAFNKKQAFHGADIWIPEFNNYAQSVEIKKKLCINAQHQRTALKIN